MRQERHIQKMHPAKRKWDGNQSEGKHSEVKRSEGKHSEVKRSEVKRSEGKRSGTKHFEEKRLSGKRLVLLLTAVLLIFFLCFAGPFSVFTMTVRADSPTDEIEHFLITVDVQEDASLQMTYHIDWKVLDDQQYGQY